MNRSGRYARIVLVALLGQLWLAGCTAAHAATPTSRPTPEQYRELAAKMDHHLRSEFLPAWFPRTIDQERGGFRTNLRDDWTPCGPNQKGLVYQSRMTWLAATVAMEAAEDGTAAQAYRGYAKHGGAFLREQLWDARFGGFFFLLDEQGKPLGAWGEQKHTYGQAFAIYALARAARATEDSGTRSAAIEAFHWLDTHAHDEKDGGYFEALDRQGTPILSRGPTTAPADQIDALEIPYGGKTMNVHIHLLEALTELYRVYPDGRLRARLIELTQIVRDRITVEPGYLNLTFTLSWEPVPGRQSYGHDMETAYLLLESADALGQRDAPKTLAVARKLVDHAIPFGFDTQHGGVFNEGEPGKPASDRIKWWWVQAEALNALLLMHEHFGAETNCYWDAFSQQWQFVNQHVIDHDHGGWFMKLSPEGKSLIPVKASLWKAGYHDGRAIIEVRNRLRRMGNPSNASSATPGN